MHIKRHVFLIVLSVLLTVPLSLLAFFSLAGVYYVGYTMSDAWGADYETVSGVLREDVQTGDTDGTVFLSLDRDSADNQTFAAGHYNFYVMDPPADFADSMKQGTRVTITAANRMFGDGWAYPAAAVSTDEGVLISLEDGQAAVRSWIAVNGVLPVIIFLIFPALFVGNILMCVFSVKALVPDVRLTRELRQRHREVPHAALLRTASPGEPGGQSDPAVK